MIGLFLLLCVAMVIGIALFGASAVFMLVGLILHATWLGLQLILTLGKGALLALVGIVALLWLLPFLFKLAAGLFLVLLVFWALGKIFGNTARPSASYYERERVPGGRRTGYAREYTSRQIMRVLARMESRMAAIEAEMARRRW